MRDMSFVLVAVVVLLWLAASGRLASAVDVLVGSRPTRKEAATDDTAAQQPSANPIDPNIANNVGWAPLDGRRFDPNLNATFSNIRGFPIRQVAGDIF